MATQVRSASGLNDSRSDFEARSCRNVLFAQVKVDVELIACELPSVKLPGHQ
jgi:hypothetical protein